jgi:hypothetical protein
MTISRAPRLARRLLIATLVLWAGAALAYGSLRLVYGWRPADINVRWSPSVDEAQRTQLEARFGLADGMPREGTTWGYSLTDVSRGNVRALVQDPLVEDTHQINRTRFTIWPEATRGPYVGAEASRLPGVLETLAPLLLLLGAIPAGLALLERVQPAMLHARLRPAVVAFAQPAAATSGLLTWIGRQVPPVTAHAVALFRIVLGLAVTALVVSRSVSSDLITAAASNVITPLQREVMLAFAAAPAVADWVTPWVVMWGALFVAGALARVSFAMLTIGVLAWAVLHVTRSGAHAVSALMLTLVCLLPSRWSDAWSVDAWLRRGRGAGMAGARDTAYGYTVWMPGVVLGVAFFAAAVAKLRESGLDWILNGAVKYHFLSDSREALVDWGAWIGTQPWLAVLLSFAAIVVEVGVIFGALSRRYRYRLLAGLAALSIMVGFALFQGLLWPAWWILLLSFLPWHRVQASPAPAAQPGMIRQPLLRVQAVAVVAVMLQQAVVSALRVEINPLLSEYEMYATSYSSPEDYERNAGMNYRLLARLRGGATASCNIDRDDAETLSDASGGADRTDLIRRLLADCMDDPARVESVSVEGRRIEIDWSRWRMAGEVSVPLAGPMPVSRGQ